MTGPPAFWQIYLQGLLLAFIAVTLLWLVSLFLRDASIVDPFWGTGFVLLVWFYYVNSPGLLARKILLVTLVSLWGLRLSLYLLWRNWGRGEDFRYRAFRQKYGPRRYWWISYFQTFLLQGFLMWLISLPLLSAQSEARSTSSGLNLLDVLGIVFWAAGMFFETVGDWQLARFKRDPANQGRVLDSGLWRYTRHPNYFGESLIWLGFGLLSAAAGTLLAVVSALLGAGLMIFLLLRVSGVTLLERSLVDRKSGYSDYIRRTSAFIPRPPRERESGLGTKSAKR